MSAKESGLMSFLDSVKAFEHDFELREAFNIFDAIGMQRQEIRHSRFLAFLLQPMAVHGLNDSFLKSFLSHAMAQVATPVISRLTLMLEDLSAAEIYTERDHFDITIWLPKQQLLIVVENKVDSGESLDQLMKYRDRVKLQYPEKKFCGIFLTADGYDGEDPDWIPVSYTAIQEQIQSIIDSSSKAITSEVRSTLKNYCQLIRKHIVTDDALIEACKLIYAKHRTAIDLITQHGQVPVVREAATRFVEQVPELVIAPGGNKWRTNMVAKTWLDLPSFQIADVAPSRWRPSCPLQLWFRLFEGKGDLILVIEVGPIIAESSFDRTDFIKTLRKEFGANNKVVTEVYTRITRLNKSVDGESVDSLEEAMKSLWIDFGGQERLRKLDDIVRKAIPL